MTKTYKVHLKRISNEELTTNILVYADTPNEALNLALTITNGAAIKDPDCHHGFYAASAEEVEYGNYRPSNS